MVTLLFRTPALKKWCHHSVLSSVE